MLVALALSPVANAQQNCGGNNAPPGNSEVDQYFETAPDACGDKPVEAGGTGAGGSGSDGAVPSSTAGELRSLGPDGRAALSLANANSPGGKGRSEPGQAVGGVADQGGGVGDVITAIADSSDGGSGWLFPLILAAVALAGAAYVIRRRSAAT